MNDNTGTYFREVTPRMYMEAINAAAAFLGADPNNLVLVQNATSVKLQLHVLKLVFRAKPYIIVNHPLCLKCIVLDLASTAR